MSRVTAAEKLALKRQTLIARTAESLDLTAAQAKELLRTPREQSLRLNPLAGNVQETITALHALGWEGEPYTWAEHGYTLPPPVSEAVRDSVLQRDGRVYIQNAASWLPVLALAPGPGERVLDVCAAPGGKTTHLAALSHNQAIITANDNSRPRLMKLRATCERLQANITNFTLYDARNLTVKFAGEGFDKILIDAPCSGEGMMHLDNDKHFDTWSTAQIKRLQTLQKRLITQAWQLLAPGGELVYSTCTMAPEENEAVIDYLLRRAEDARVVPIEIDLPNRVAAVTSWHGKTFYPVHSQSLRLRPSSQIEAFFVAKIRKR